MAKRLLILILMGTGLVLAMLGADKRTTHGDWVYLQNGSGVRISIETFRAKGGWTPVVVSLGGTSVSAVMDRNGRVVHDWVKGLDKRGVALFTIELGKNRILLGREMHSIRVYEQNGMRTRFEIAESVIQLPVMMDPTGKNGKLRFGGLEIPAQVSDVDRAALGRVISPKEAKTGLGAIRPLGSNTNQPASRASAQVVSRGFGARAQLDLSRIRARGK